MTTGTRINWVRVIGGWEVIGGITSVAYIFGHASMKGAGAFTWFVFIVTLSAALLSVVAGIALLRGWAEGRPLSLATQVIQVFGFSFGTFAYRLVVGPYVILSWMIGSSFNLNFGMDVGSLFAVSLRQQVVTPFIAINLLAAGCFLYLVEEPQPARGARRAGIA